MGSTAHGRPQQSRVAIIGTGLAGLTTDHLLRHDEKERYSVTLFEQAQSLSFDAASVTIRDRRTDAVERIDVPMRASAGGYYANLLRMYDYLGIPLHPVRFLFVFAKALSGRGAAVARPESHAAKAKESAANMPGTYFVHASNLHQTPPPWPANRGIIAHVVEVVYLIACHFWFSVACFLVQPIMEPSSNGGSSVSLISEGGETVAQYLERIWLPRRYVSHYLLPLMSSVSTCSHEELLSFPASDLVNYKKLSHGQQHYTVCGGVNQVEAKLAEGMDNVRLGARVLDVAPLGDNSGIMVRWQSVGTGSGELTEERFDRVVMAVSPDVAGRIFKPLAHVLEKIPTIQVESSVLSPASGEERWTYETVEDEMDGAPTACMHHAQVASPTQTITLRTRFNKTGSKTEALHTMPSGVVVSTCASNEDFQSRKPLRTSRFTRTLRSAESRAVVETVMGRGRPPLDSLGGCWVNGEDNVWLTGAWCWDGMVLLEGCIVSAMRVADDFGVSVPWREGERVKY